MESNNIKASLSGNYSLACKTLKQKIGNKRYIKIFYFISFLLLIPIAHLFLNITTGISIIDIKFASTTTDDDGLKGFTQAEIAAMGLIVDVPGCKIPSIDPWDSSIKPFFPINTTQHNCGSEIPHFTHVNGTTVVINVTAVQEAGHQISNVQCCYQTILRLEQNVTHHNQSSDKMVRFSKTCSTLDIVTPIFAEFIKVTCADKNKPLVNGSYPSIYANFHMIAQPTTDRVHQILKYWKMNEEIMGPKKRAVPPSVLIFGLDSLSRLNFRRGMPKARKELEEMGAHEMYGYTKVGENTLPNEIPYFTGYYEPQMDSIETDEIPFIWKYFEESANYLTALIEDCPFLALFNLYRSGFVAQPTTFYARAGMLAAYKYDENNETNLDLHHHKNCVGYKSAGEYGTDYAKDIIKLAHASKVPVFLNAFMTELVHDDFVKIQTEDEHYTKLFHELLVGGFLENSILFFMGDHGSRMGNVRLTRAGWFEDRLPNMWIRLGKNIKNKYPEWEEALSLNERRLSSHFDFYHTFLDILQTFSNFTGVPNDILTKKGTKEYRRFGQSLFKPIDSDRTCEMAGVPEKFCACRIFNQTDTASSVVLQTAQLAIKDINKLLPPQCAQFSLSKIMKSEKYSSLKKQDEDLNVSSQIVVVFSTHPGEFIFEITGKYREDKILGNETIELMGQSQRLNIFSNTDISCMENPKMKHYCYCHLIHRKNTAQNLISKTYSE